MAEDRLIETSELRLEREILRAGAEETAPPAVCRRALGALGLLLVAPTAAAASGSATAGSVTTKLLGTQAWVAKLGVVVALGGGAGAGYWLAMPPKEPASAVAAPAERARPGAAPESKAAPSEVSTINPVEPERKSAAGEPKPAPAASSRTHRSAPSAKQNRAARNAASAGTLSAEVALLDRARDALDRQAPEASLAILAEYFARHPRGELRQEAGAIRAQAMQARTGMK